MTKNKYRSDIEIHASTRLSALVLREVLKLDSPTVNDVTTVLGRNLKLTREESLRILRQLCLSKKIEIVNHRIKVLK